MSEQQDVLARIEVDRQRATVYEHGWQSWSPTTAYRLDQRPFLVHRDLGQDLRRVGHRETSLRTADPRAGLDALPPRGVSP